jgi:hypothetical protein
MNNILKCLLIKSSKPILIQEKVSMPKKIILIKSQKQIP